MAKIYPRLRNELAKELRKASVALEDGDENAICEIPATLTVVAARIITRLGEPETGTSPARGNAS